MGVRLIFEQSGRDITAEILGALSENLDATQTRLPAPIFRSDF